MSVKPDIRIAPATIDEVPLILRLIQGHAV
jgi:hypothetical protein